MKYFASIVIAAFCISAALAQSNIESLRSKISANEKAFKDNMDTKEADMLAYRRSNQDKINAAIDKSRESVNSSPVTKCSAKAIVALNNIKRRFTEFSLEITVFFNQRKAIIEREANAGFKADRKVADDLQKKYEACADDTCKTNVNKEIDAKVAEPANDHDVPQTDYLAERARRYSDIVTSYLLMRVEFNDFDWSSCVKFLKRPQN